VVTYLPDGYALLNPAVVFAPGTNVDWASHSEDLDAYGRVLISMGSFLIESEAVGAFIRAALDDEGGAGDEGPGGETSLSEAGSGDEG